MDDIQTKIQKLAKQSLKGEIQELQDIMEVLRDKTLGCPWDKEQDHSSIGAYLLEEAYEAVEAIDSKNVDNIVGELGDVLLQVIFHSQIGKENGTFSLSDVIKSISEKMIRRHPHVFSNTLVKDSAEVLKNWDEIKSKEKNDSAFDPNKFTSKLKKLPISLPALIKAEKIGEKSAQVNFDWKTIGDVLLKIDEELSEIKSAFAELDPLIQSRNIPYKSTAPDSPHMVDIGSEIGDAIFSLTQLARWLGLSAEILTKECCERFIKRLDVIESSVGKRLPDLSEDEKKVAWLYAKKIIKMED